MRLHGTRSRYNQGCHCEACTAANRLYLEQRRRRAGMQPQKRGRTCGTISGYQGGCRCEACRRANTDATLRGNARRNARLGELPAERHGQAATYGNWGCRCRPCTDAHTARCRGYDQAQGLA